MPLLEMLLYTVKDKLDLSRLPAVQARLQLTQQMLSLGDLAQQRAALRHEEILVR
jgi:hypothetical protein